MAGCLNFIFYFSKKISSPDFLVLKKSLLFLMYSKMCLCLQSQHGCSKYDEMVYDYINGFFVYSLVHAVY